MEIATAIGGLIVGLIIGYLIVRQRLQDPINKLQQEAAVAAATREHVEQSLREAQEKLRGLEAEAVELRTTRTQLESTLESERLRTEEKVTALENLHQRFQDTFKALSGEALRSNNAQFLELARETLSRFQSGAQSDLEKRQTAIDSLVKPLQEALQKVDGKVSELERVREGAYAGLQEQIRGMALVQAQLQGETANLVQALRTPNVRGQWGEVQLERTVEFAGMVDHVHFVQQESTSTEEGRLRPDMLVRLPNGNQVVVDAKAPLDAYLSALSATDPAEKERHLQRHARQIRDHIRKLGAKQYWKQFEPAPEFVVLFIPGESFFSAALEQDPGLIEAGSSENVIIATPTTLIALLKAVAYGWRQEQIAEQAKAISDLGREIYERLAVVGGHFEKLGRSLERSVDSYNQAVRSIDTRVFVTARKFKELAPLTEKEIPALPEIDRSVQPSHAAEWALSDDAS